MRPGVVELQRTHTDERVGQPEVRRRLTRLTVVVEGKRNLIVADFRGLRWFGQVTRHHLIPGDVRFPEHRYVLVDVADPAGELRQRVLIPPVQVRAARRETGEES